MTDVLSRPRLLGIVFLTLLLASVYLTYAIFTKKFVQYDEVRLQTSSVGLQLPQRADIKLLHTPYRGGADAARDVMGGQIDAALITTSTARGTLATGKTRMLAVTSATRVQAYADVPTIAERGFPGYDMDDWFGLFAAAGTPEGPIKRMEAAVAQAARDPALAAAVAPQGFVLVASSSQEFSQWLNSQRELLQKLIRDANISIG